MSMSLNADTLRRDVGQLKAQVQAMTEEHQRLKDALTNLTAQINSKLGELTAYQRLLAQLEQEAQEEES